MIKAPRRMTPVVISVPTPKGKAKSPIPLVISCVWNQPLKGWINFKLPKENIKMPSTQDLIFKDFIMTVFLTKIQAIRTGCLTQLFNCLTYRFNERNTDGETL